MSVIEHREKLLDSMENNSIAVVWAGRPTLANEDEYLPFAVNSFFYYLTGSARQGQILLLVKAGEHRDQYMFIDPVNETTERWTGRMPRRKEVQALTGIENVEYTSDFNSVLGLLMGRFAIDTAYFDVFRCEVEDLPTWNAEKAAEFATHYPAVRIADLHRLCGLIRETKDKDEVEAVRQAIGITAKGLDNVLRTLEPGMMEYQIQAIFEGTCHYEGARDLAFPTIAAGGSNACSMHYDANNARLNDGELILFDLGAKYGNYCSDISRTYPIGGRYTQRQRELYDIVLKANRAVAETAAPGVTFGELEEVTERVLSEGLMELGMIDSPEEVRTYYPHSVSHSIGIDPHDVSRREVSLQAGWIISDEPGLYIDEEGIGIRIEDDLLITEDGCEVLSSTIPSDPDEIERLMAAARS